MRDLSPDRNDNLAPEGTNRRAFLKTSIQASLAAGLWVAGGCATAPRPSLPNVLLITLDTTRFDRLSCYGYTLPTSPNLDALAEQSVFYTRAYSTSSWTLPAHASLFTGKLVSSHGVQKDPSGPLRLSSVFSGHMDWDKVRARGLSTDETTLAQLLKQAGYDTGAVVAGPWMKKIFGLNKGFDFYDDDGIEKLNGRSGAEVTKAAVKWLRARDASNPFFLFLNYFDPHHPYILSRKDASVFMPTDRSYSETEKADRLYAAEIRFMDQQIGLLMDRLKRTGQFDNTMIVITADHGELMGEHGKTAEHGHTLYEPEIRIPQFVKYPAGEVAQSVVDTRTQLVDIMPLILERIDVPTPSGIQGTLPGQGLHPLVVEVYPLELFSDKGNFQAILEDKYKFVRNSKGNHALFNLDDDPGEMKNLLHEDSARADALKSKLITRLAALPKPGRAGPEQEVGEELQETLESMGYLE
ncbi:MAG: sulfatase [Candidatus Hydrogenedentes bacterium]|nr:sulfatase [Candidatus Hydrogenedentota bacterium]